MKSLYLRIYATVVVVLLLFAIVSGWVVERHLDQERARSEQVVSERLGAWAELLEHSLPGADAPADVQAAALLEWSQRLRVPLALDDANGERIGASGSFARRIDEGLGRAFAFRLSDGRTLWTMRPGLRQLGAGGRAGGRGGGQHAGPAAPGAEPGALDVRPAGEVRPPRAQAPPWPFLPPGLPRGAGLAVVLLLLFVAVAAGAYPVVRRLTRRLESLKQGVEQFGAGKLSHRVEVNGADEVAAVAASFNVAAARVEALVQSHRSLLANASHELCSPLARMKMAVSMLEEASPEQRDKLKVEIDKNVAELDGLVEEVLLASRLDAAENPLHRDRVDLLAVAAEEAARVGAEVDAQGDVFIAGDERLLRRALRNLLENAQRYGGGDVELALAPERGGKGVTVQVCDRGPGVPASMRERIFEPFFRLPGHAEQAGGVGLGLALVKQIAVRHGGSVRCDVRPGGGSCFVLVLPAA
ncbi:MAG: HAMP domain-containing sensor histidine kinase [Caldimonas sp.]